MKKRKAWFYDIKTNMLIEFREYEPGMLNNGDYHHTDFVGPFRTAKGAWVAGRKELKANLSLAERALLEFDQFYRQSELEPLLKAPSKGKRRK